MILLKCVCSLSGKCSKRIPHSFRNKNPIRTYTLLTAERKIFRKLRSPLSFQSYTSSVSHLSALKSNEKLKDNPTIQLQPLKFEDLSFDQPVLHDDLINALYKCKTVSEQMEMLASTLSLCSYDIENRIKFCKTLESFFKPIFSEFKVQIFGSTINGFGFKGCDIDVSFETSSKRSVAPPGKEKNYIEEPDIPLLSEVLSGRVTPQEICALPPKDKLHFIHNVMLDYYKESVEPPIFINAHVPLIRFHHEKFGLKCDLTYKNKVAFANTKLLYLYYKLDKRVGPFLMTTRYWAKHHELIGKGLMFNSYTVSLMAIYFLQSRNPSVLPSVKSILDLHDNFKDNDMIDESFFNTLEKIPPSKNEQSLEELLREFFLFYSYFDFTQVICPMTATAVPIEDFRAREENFKFKNNTFCIQDPMCLPHNVADLVKFEYCVKFVHETVIACNMFQKDDLSKPSTNPWGLISILNTPKYSYNSLSTSKAVSFSIPLLSKSKIGEIPHSERASVSVDTLVKILNALLFTYKTLNTSEYLNLLQMQDGLILKDKMTAKARDKNKMITRQFFKKFNDKTEPEVTKIESTQDLEVEETMQQQFQNFCSENQLIFCAQCSTSENVWDNRCLVKLGVTCDSKSILEKVKLISSLTAEENAKKKVTEPYLFLCECFLSKENPETLIVNFRPYKKLYFKLIVSTFLKEYIPKIMRNISEQD